MCICVCAKIQQRSAALNTVCRGSSGMSLLGNLLNMIKVWKESVTIFSTSILNGPGCDSTRALLGSACFVCVHMCMWVCAKIRQRSAALNTVCRGSSGMSLLGNLLNMIKVWQESVTIFSTSILNRPGCDSMRVLLGSASQN